LSDNPVRASIFGSRAVDCTDPADTDSAAIHRTNGLFWDTKGHDVLEPIALPYYGAFISEKRRNLFGGVSGKKALEIGCGRGHSLRYIGERGAAELWGMDISEKQLEKASQLLVAHGLSARLICAPMEEECGIPKGYFDVVYSVYAIGWTTDLEGTVCRVASYLKKDGVFIFSWSHPIHKCVAVEKGVFAFKRCYFDESWYSLSLGGGVLTMADRKLSTYINALAKAGFVIERMIEEPDEEIPQARAEKSEFAAKARMLPAAFVIKARKL
jgi:SAM-dependent methyltransferase